MSEKVFYNHGGHALSELASRAGATEGTVDLLNAEGAVCVEGVQLVVGAPGIGQASLTRGDLPAAVPADQAPTQPVTPPVTPPSGPGKDPVAAFAALLQADQDVSVEDLKNGLNKEQLIALAATFDIEVPDPAATKADIAALILGPAEPTP